MSKQYRDFQDELKPRKLKKNKAIRHAKKQNLKRIDYDDSYDYNYDEFETFEKFGKRR